jgi:hypothetical protein
MKHNLFRTFRIFAILSILLTLFVFPVLASAPAGRGPAPQLQTDRLASLIELIAGSGFLIGVILSVVEWIKTTKLPPVLYPYASMLTGLAFGLAFMAYRAPLLTFSDWFIAVLYGIVLGLIASGLFMLGASLAKKAQPELPVMTIANSPVPKIDNDLSARLASISRDQANRP